MKVTNGDSKRLDLGGNSPFALEELLDRKLAFTTLIGSIGDVAANIFQPGLIE